MEAANDLATEAWLGLAGVQKNWPRCQLTGRKLNIKGIIDNKGQNEIFIDRESKMKLKNRKITLGLVHGCASFLFQVSMQLRKH